MERCGPAGEVEVGVSEMHEVPVDEDRSAVGEAEVVAPDVQMQKRISIDRSTLGGRSVGRHSSSHRRTSAEREEGAGPVRSRPSPTSFPVTMITGPRGAGVDRNSAECRPNCIDRAAVPRRGQRAELRSSITSRGGLPAS
jgi:hypothetical protein